ncbi:MAG: autotransporter-associated beta strand repeat-containing protein [Chthoniobacter sp.]
MTDTTGYTNTLNFGGSVDSIKFNAAVASSNVTIGANVGLDVASGGILETSNVGGARSHDLGGSLTSASGELIVTQQNTLGTLTISSNINGLESAQNQTGSVSFTGLAFTKMGAGTVILSGNNAYSGNTTIAEGTLQLAGGNAIGDASQVVLATSRGPPSISMTRPKPSERCRAVEPWAARCPSARVR